MRCRLSNQSSISVIAICHCLSLLSLSTLHLQRLELDRIGAAIRWWSVQENLAAMVMKLCGTCTPSVELAILPLFLADVDPEKEMEMVLVSLSGKQQLKPAYKAKNSLEP